MFVYEKSGGATIAQHLSHCHFLHVLCSMATMKEREGAATDGRLQQDDHASRWRGMGATKT
jgi:hypothetical protein